MTFGFRLAVVITHGERLASDLQRIEIDLEGYSGQCVEVQGDYG